MGKLIDELRSHQPQRITTDFENPPTPQLFRSSNNNFESDLINFLQKNKSISIHDLFLDQLKELFHIRNPHLNGNSGDFYQDFKKFSEKRKKKENHEYSGTWVYYPWLKKLIHILDEEEFQEVRTARNRYLLTAKEQDKFLKSVVGIAGLSIGNSVALSLAYSGGCQNMKLADPDRFSLSNLNRVRVPLYFLGVRKVYVAAEQTYEVNPFATIKLFPEGLTQNNIKDFLIGSSKLNIVVDEMDDLKMKIFIRLAARAVKIPVVMATDNGDSGIIDIDRFDHKSKLGQLAGLPNIDLDTVILGMNEGEPFELTKLEQVKLSTKLVGAANAVPRMQNSLQQVGKELVSWPQLATAAFLGGAILTYVIKKIILGEKIKSGKIPILLDEIFINGINSSKEKAIRKKQTQLLEAYINDPHLIKYDNYAVWETEEKGFPKKGNLKDKLYFLLNYSIAAPSSHNTQPWKFLIQDNIIKVLFDKSRMLKISDPTHREFYISLGACISNLLVAGEYFNFDTHITYFPDKNSERVADINFTSGENKKNKHANLFPAIMQRYSERSNYINKPLSQKLLMEIIALNDCDSLHLTLITDQKIMKMVALLDKEGTRSIMENKHFRNELSEWLRHNYTRQFDGMPGSNSGFNDLQSIIGPFLIKYFNMDSGSKDINKSPIVNSAALIVISADSESPFLWVKAGELYEKIVLLTTLYNVKNSTQAAVIEADQIYIKLMKLLNLKSRPLVFFRLGYFEGSIKRSPRLPVALVTNQMP